MEEKDGRLEDDQLTRVKMEKNPIFTRLCVVNERVWSKLKSERGIPQEAARLLGDLQDSLTAPLLKRDSELV